MKLPQLSLTTKIANYFLLLALISVSIVGGVAYFNARNALKQAAFERLRVAATLKQQEISRWFEDQQRNFLQTTQMPDVQYNLDLLLNSQSDREAYPAGNRDQQDAYQVLTQYLTQASRIKPSLREIFVLDRNNKIILSTNSKREGEYEILANITYVEQVEIGANFAPIFYVSPITGKPAITLAKPLADRSGMILVDLDLERIDSIVREKTGLGESGESYLVGSLISTNVFIAGKSPSKQPLPKQIDSPAINAAMSGVSGYGMYPNYEQNPVLGVYRWLNEQDIALLVEICQEEAFAPAHKLASAIVLVGLICVVGLLVGVNWLALQLSASRQQLEQSSQQLKLKAQEAEAANRAKSMFLANMSHELRTPLNAILGFSQLLSWENTITATQKESLDIINRSGEHLLNLINDVLEMSKIEAGKITLNAAAFDLHQLLQTIQQMFQIRAEAKQLWFKLELAHNLPQYVVGDCRKLRQLLINLMSNAVKFTQSGGVTLRANVRQRSPKQKQVQLYFEVTDTGKGIAPEEQDRLFDPFVQTKSGIQSQGGTGLGLAISRQFAELMGGNIQASSILGKGSVFTFNIQAELANAPTKEVSLPRPQIRRLTPGQKDYRIAIVDDQETNRLALGKLLELVGFKTRTATNGQDAIALWQEWQPDLIWMDMRMPIMDGYEATRQIKSQSVLRETVIIAITASAFEEQKDKIFSAGCDDLVAKPFTEQVIFDKLTQHLGVKFTDDTTHAGKPFVALRGRGCVLTYQTESRYHQSQPSLKLNQPLSNQDLALLSPSLVTKINQAAIAVDREQIEQLITYIPDAQQYIARGILEMLNKYDFDGIIDVTTLACP
ncbi:MAG: ATP-binding protein [Cyanobacteria bacterium J06642_3]